MKKAFLVTFAPIVRVVVDDSSSDEEIVNAAIDKASQMSFDDLICYDNLEDIRPDDECPL